MRVPHRISLLAIAGAAIMAGSAAAVTAGPAAAVTAGLAAAAASAPAVALTITSITRAQQPVTSAPDVSLRALDGRALRQGVRLGFVLPNDVRVEVPARVSLTITSAGGSKAVLEPGAIDSFHYTGSLESVAVNAGKTSFDDPLDFYRASGPGFDALARGTVYSVAVDSSGVAIVCKGGSVLASALGTTAAGIAASVEPGVLEYLRRVDTMAADRHWSVSYQLRQSPDELAAQARAERSAAVATALEAEVLTGIGGRARATKGDPDAELNLGLLYLAGRGLEQSDSSALHWLGLAAARGSAGAQSSLGFAYATGRGAAPDYAAALHWYRLGGLQGAATAENGTGFLYAFAASGPHDYVLGRHWFELAAAQGDAAAETNLGSMYAAGDGVPRDYPTAAYWYRLAAAQGEAYAEAGLGALYASGHGVRRDFAAALDHYRRAAAAGEDRAAGLALAHMYATGEGVAADRGTAFGWILIANALSNGAPVREAYKTALITYSVAEQAAGRVAAQRFVDDYAARTGTRLSLPPLP